jgi:hypothetical protein
MFEVLISDIFWISVDLIKCGTQHTYNYNLLHAHRTLLLVL